MDIFAADVGYHAIGCTNGASGKSTDHLREHAGPHASRHRGFSSHHVCIDDRHYEHGGCSTIQCGYGPQSCPPFRPASARGVLFPVEEAPRSRHLCSHCYWRLRRRHWIKERRQPLLEGDPHELQRLLVRSCSVLWKAGDRGRNAGWRSSQLH